VVPPADIAPAYKGLANQTVGVMVWVDRGVRVDYPNLQADIARDLTTKLNQATKPRDPKDKAQSEVANIRYLDPMAIVRFQADHPELEGTPSKDVAVRLGVTRVIYLEVYSFETRPNESIDLFKGTLLSKMEVLEVSPPTAPGAAKVAKIAYTDGDMRSVYPPKRPEGVGGTDVNAEYIYRKTVDQYTTDVALTFITHPPL
jgi:hypothetical protein